MGNGVSRAVIEVLLDRVSQGAATLSPEDQIVYANQRLASMLGVSRAQLVGRVLAELAAEPDRATLADAIGLGRDGASQCRVTLPRADGEVQALLTFAPLGHGQLSVVVTDLAQVRNAGALAHEVRNTLGSVRNSISLLRRNPLDPESERGLESLERQAARLLGMVEELRRVSPKE